MKENKEMENRIKELENKVLEQQKEREEYLRKAVNAEISKVEKENEWLMTTIVGIIKEGNIATRSVAYQIKHQFNLDDKEFEKWFSLSSRVFNFNPWRAIELPDSVFKKMYPHDWEIKEAQARKEKEEIIKRINEKK